MDTLFEEDLLDPAPDIHALFVHFNDLYFQSSLGGVLVQWSSARMTLCGGTCERLAGGALIKLSKPLLTLRPASDLKMVLLHEMIHAYMFVHGIRDDDPTGGGHGSQFRSKMDEINNSKVPDHQRPVGGYKIGVYHIMIEEVRHYRQHHWKCQRCGVEIQRAMNRPPQEADCRGRAGSKCADPACRYHTHIKKCGGTFVKTKEPEGYADKKKRAKEAAVAPPGRSIKAYFARADPPQGDGEDGQPLPAMTAALEATAAARAAGKRGVDAAAPPPEDAEVRRKLFAAAALRRATAGAAAVDTGVAPRQQ